MQFSILIKTGITALLIVLIMIPASAQDGLDTSQVYQLDEVIISASRWEQSPQSVGRNVTVISRQVINRSIHSSVGDLLAEQQSVHIIGNGQTAGSVQSVFLRNANSNHSVVMIDGIRISDPSTAGNGIDLSEVSLAGVERIEIVRGSHSTLYGSSAIGGVINIITRKDSGGGLSGDIETNQGTFGSGSYSMTNNLSANYTFQNGLFLDIGAVQEQTQGLDATVDTISSPTAFNPQDRDDFNKLDLTGKVGYKNSRFGIYASWRREDQNTDLDQAAYADDDNAGIDFRRNLYSYAGSYIFSDKLELRFSGAYSNLARDFVNDSSVVNAGGNYDGTYTETNGKGALWGNELTGHFQRKGFSAIVGLGNTQQTMSNRNFIYSSAFNFRSVTDLDSLDLRETINHAFIHAELNGGLINKNLDAFTLGLGSRLAAHNQFRSHLTFEINPKVQIASSALVYGAVSSGFNAPSLYQLHSPGQSFGAYTNRGNNNLDPETSLSIEAGWKQQIGNRVHLEIVFFKTRLKNAIEYIYLWNKNTPVENLGFADYLGDTYINISQQDISGIELGIKAQLLAGLNITGNLTYTKSTSAFSPDDIDESYTGGHHVQIFEGGQFVDGRKEANGLVRRPQVLANARVTWRPGDRLEIGATTSFTGANDDIFYSAALGPFGALGRSEVDPYNITDLYAGYQVSSHISLKIKVENIFNTDYSEIKGYNTRARGLYGRVRYTF